MSVVIFPKFSRSDSAADVRDAISVYSTTEVDNLLDALGGADGASAYEIAVANGFVGNEAAWLASLVGATGATGATGETGPAGPNEISVSTLSSYDGILKANGTNVVVATGGTDYLRPSDIASGTITARTGAIDFSGGSDGDVLTVQADGSLAPETPAGGGIGGSTGSTDNAILRADGVLGATVQSSGVTIDDSGKILTTANPALQTAGGVIIYNTFVNARLFSANGWLSLTENINGGLNLGSSMRVAFGSSASNSPSTNTSGDVALSRNQSGRLEINSNALGEFRDLILRKLDTTEGTNFLSGASDPTTTDIPAGYGVRWKNTTSGEIRDWVNDAGEIKTVGGVAGGGAEEVSDLTETITVTMGDGEPIPPTTIFSSNFETGNDGWTLSGVSRETTQAQSGSWSIYFNADQSYLNVGTMTRTVTLTNTGTLTFYRRLSRQGIDDGARMWVTDNGTQIAGYWSALSSSAGFVNFGTRDTWILTTINLTAGTHTLQLLFRGESDNSSGAAIWVDNFTLTQNGGTPTVFKFNGNSKENLLLLPGVDYKFDQSDASNTVQLKFSNKPNNIDGTEYTTGVTATGTTGTDGIVSFKVPYNAPTRLYPFANGSSVAGNDSSFVVGYASPTDFGLVDVISGSTGSVDNAILRTDGTGGGTVQASGVTVSDNNEILVVAGTAASVPLTVRGAASQTANLFELTNSSGDIRSSVGPNGEIFSRSTGRFSQPIYLHSDLATSYITHNPINGNNTIIGGQQILLMASSSGVAIHSGNKWDASAMLDIECRSSSFTGQIVRGKPGQTASLCVWQDNTAATIAAVEADGAFFGLRLTTEEGVNFLSGASDPTTTDIPSGYGARWKNTTSGEIRDWVNDGGTIRVVSQVDNRREFFPTIANNSTDAEHDLDIGAARIWVSDGTTEKLVDFAAATKQIDAAWAAGTNQGGLDTGTAANSTWYYIWAIYNPTTDSADYLLSVSATSPTMPSGYTYKCRIPKQGACRTDGSANVIACTWHGDYATFNSTITDLAVSNSFQTLATVTVPPNWRWFGVYSFTSSAENAYFHVVGGGFFVFNRTSSSGLTFPATSHGTIRVNGSSQLELSTSSASSQILSTRGFGE